MILLKYQNEINERIFLSESKNIILDYDYNKIAYLESIKAIVSRKKLGIKDLFACISYLTRLLSFANEYLKRLVLTFIYQIVSLSFFALFSYIFILIIKILNEVFNLISSSNNIRSKAVIYNVLFIIGLILIIFILIKIYKLIVKFIIKKILYAIDNKDVLI